MRMVRGAIQVSVVALLAAFFVALVILGPPPRGPLPAYAATPTATPTPSIFSEYTYSSGIGTKSAITAAVTAATTASLVSNDAPTSVLTSNPYITQTFTAAQTAALGILAGMTGPAPDCQVTISAYSDPSVAASMPYAAVGKVTISVTEVWP